MKFSRLSFLLTVFCGSLTLVTPRASGRVREVGNGGDVVSIEFSRMALDLAIILESDAKILPELSRDAFQAMVRNMRVDSEEQVFLRDPATGKDLPKDATNHPDMTPPQIYVSRAFWNRKDVDYALRQALVLHEVLGLMGSERGRYTQSAEILRSDLLPFARSRAVLPLEIYRYDRPGDKAGLPWSEVLRICASYRRLYSQKYFHVFCHIDEQRWNETVARIREHRKPVFVGYEVDARSDASAVDFSGHAADYGRYGYRVRAASLSLGLGASESSEGYQQRPLVEWESIPVTVYETVMESVHGLRVVAVGDLSLLPWNVLLSSDHQLGGRVVRTFASNLDAESACAHRLVRLREGNPDVFYRSRCRFRPLTNGQVAYDIESQNPYVVAAP